MGDCDDLDFFFRAAIDDVEGEIHENETAPAVTGLRVALRRLLYSKERLLHGANELTGRSVASLKIPIDRL